MSNTFAQHLENALGKEFTVNFPYGRVTGRLESRHKYKSGASREVGAYYFKVGILTFQPKDIQTIYGNEINLR